ncbi:MAG: DUF1611 domain-containing protein [Vicingaceae bacterium]
MAKALVYCENEFSKVDGKVANGLARQSDKYDIVGIIDSSKAGSDAGEILDGIKNSIPIFSSTVKAVDSLGFVPEYFIYGIAPLSSFLESDQRQTLILAMTLGMNIVNGLPEFLTEDKEFVRLAAKHGVKILDVRKPPNKKDQHNFSGKIRQVNVPVIAVMGTDCAVGKRTTAILLVNALRNEGLKAIFVTTGQTGILQGSKYGVAVDVLTSGYATGEVENAVCRANEKENPDIIIVEGQGALSHPAFTSSVAILRGAMPDGIIIQHPPTRKNHCDYPDFPMPTLKSEIELIESFSNTKVIAITLNHEGMTDAEIDIAQLEYELKYRRPVVDALKYGCDKLVQALKREFPELEKRELPI